MTDVQTHPLALSSRSFGRLREFITREIGIKMSPAKLPLLQSRLQRRLRALALPSLEDYQRYLFHSAGGEAERVHFFDAITTNKTDFFREPQHFEHLVRRILPVQDPDPAGHTPWSFKVWCAGCSSGEEPYTLAMVLAEYAVRRPGFSFSLLATDISQRVLAHAARGIYAADRIEPIAPVLRSKYLLRSRDPGRAEVKIVPELRQRVLFQRLNFMDSDYGIRERFDAIFFRNVMIYFDKPTQQAVLQKLCHQLVSGGHLFVGHSESLTGLHVPVTCVATAVYRRE